MAAADSVFVGTLTQPKIATPLKTMPPNGDFLSIVLNVISMSGDGVSLNFRVQWSLDGAIWAEASPPDAFAPITTPGAVIQRFTAKGQYWRAVCELAGTTPSFTGSVNCYS